MPVEFLEDMAVGERVVIGSYRFTAENVADFADQFDPQAAARMSDAAPQASAWQVLAAWMNTNLSYQDQVMATEVPPRGRWPEFGPSPGFENLSWPGPVHVGDEVTYENTLFAKRPLASRPGWGLISFGVEGRNQNGELVIVFLGKVLVQMIGDAG